MRAIFVLSGGGANGAFQAGVLYELLHAGVRPAAVYGVSVGALNAIAVAQSQPELLREVWATVRESDVIRRRSGLSLVWHLLRGSDSLYDWRPLRRLLDRYYVPERAACPMYAGAVAMALQPPKYYAALVAPQPAHPITGQPMSREECLDWMAGSATMPVLGSPIGELLLADGGQHNVTPLGDAIEMQADTPADCIIAVLCKPYPPPAPRPDLLTRRPKRIDDAIRLTLDVMVAGIATEDIDRARDVNAMVKTAQQHGVQLQNRHGKPMEYVPLHIIAPAQELLGGHGTLNFERAAIRERWELGAAAGREFARSMPGAEKAG